MHRHRGGCLALIVAYLGFVVVLFLVPPGGLQLPVPPLWLDVVASTVVLTLYLAVSWHRGGRTYGDLVMGLRVVDRRTRDPGLVTALLRAALNVVFPLGLAWVAISRQNRSIQDVALRTVGHLRLDDASEGARRLARGGWRRPPTRRSRTRDRHVTDQHD